MSRARVPLVAVVVAVLVAAFVVERDQPVRSEDVVDVDLARAAPQIAPDDALGSTWYCAAGSAEPEGPADHTVVIANPSDTDRTAVLTVFPGQADPITVEASLPARSIERRQVSDLATAPAAAVMVEVPGGEVVVTHELTGPLGRDSGPCASSSSDVWHFAWGDTSRDARSLVALLNPFPGDAVVDFRFVTVDGQRRPTALTGVVVPGESVVVVDVGTEVTRRDQVSATATARSGRVIAERLQLFDDTEEMLEGSVSRRGLTVELGSPAPMPTWIHPRVRLAEGLIETLVVYNPSDATAEVDVELLGGGASIEPFELTVGANGYERLVLTDQARIEDLLQDGPLETTVVVRSLNDVGVVTERVTQVPTTAEGPGIVTSLGTPFVGTRLVIADPRPLDTADTRLTLVNPDPTELVTGTITVVSRGVARPLEPHGSFELAPAGRLSVDTVAGVSGSGTSVLVIETDRPVAASLTGRSTEPPDRLAWEASGVSGDLDVPPGFFAG